MLYNNWFMLQLCVCRDIEHLGSLESTKEARVASFVLSELPAYLIAELSRAKRASGAPWVRKFGKLTIRENLVVT